MAKVTTLMRIKEGEKYPTSSLSGPGTDSRWRQDVADHLTRPLGAYNGSDSVRVWFMRGDNVIIRLRYPGHRRRLTRWVPRFGF